MFGYRLLAVAKIKMIVIFVVASLRVCDYRDPPFSHWWTAYLRHGSRSFEIDTRSWRQSRIACNQIGIGNRGNHVVCFVVIIFRGRKQIMVVFHQGLFVLRYRSFAVFWIGRIFAFSRWKWYPTVRWDEACQRWLWLGLGIKIFARDKGGKCEGRKGNTQGNHQSWNGIDESGE